MRKRNAPEPPATQKWEGPAVRFDPERRANYHTQPDGARVYHGVPDGHTFTDAGELVPAGGLGTPFPAEDAEEMNG